MNYQEQKYYQQGKIDGIKEFARELKKHSCSYDLEEWMDFDAVNVEVIDTLMNDCINKILAEITASEEWIQHFITNFHKNHPEYLVKPTKSNKLGKTYWHLGKTDI